MLMNRDGSRNTMSNMSKKPNPPFTNSNSVHSTTIQALWPIRHTRHAYPRNVSAIMTIPGSHKLTDKSVPSMYIELDIASTRNG